MTGKISLITEPDILANDDISIMLINLTTDDEQLLTDHLSKNSITENVNIYVHRGDTANITWLLTAFAHSRYTLINLDDIDPVSGTYATYFMGRSKTYFHTTNEDMATIMSPISVTRVDGVVSFFEKIGLIDHGQDA